MNDNLPRNPVRPPLIRLHPLAPREEMIPEDGFPARVAAVQKLENPIRRGLQLFLLLSGMRATATVEMQWPHVDWTGKTLLVPVPKGGPSRAFRLPLSQQMLVVLDRMKIYSEAGWAFAGSEWIFPSAESKTGHVQELKQQRDDRLIGPHALRRTFATVAADVVPGKHLSFLLNHSTLKTITDHYIVRQPKALAISQQRISDAIVERLGVKVEEVLGPVHSGTATTFGQAPPWRDAA